MNLVLTFVHPSKPPKALGPFRSIRLDGESLRERAEGPAIAVHREHQWEVQGQRYFRLDADARVRCHFEQPRSNGRSRAFGPYAQFSAVDGIAYTDGRVFAFVDGKVGDWFCYDDGRHWPVLIVTDESLARSEDRLRSLAALAPLLPGVLALWEGARMLYLGRAGSIRGRLERLADEWPGRGITGVSWETADDPAAREAELTAAYESGSSSLMSAFGRLHGSLVRTVRLIEKARATAERSSRLLAVSRAIRAGAG